MASLFSVRSNRLPSKGTVGDVYFTTDCHEIYICAGDGTLLNLKDLLSGAVPHTRAVGPKGEAGPQGSPGADGRTVIGPRGPQGAPGERGADGKTPSRQEIAEIVRSLAPELRGEPGVQGCPGRDAVAHVSLDAVAESRIAALEQTVQALLDANKKGRSYIAWLQSRVAAKAKVLRFVHLTHSAGTQFMKDAVVRDSLTEQLALIHGTPNSSSSRESSARSSPARQPVFPHTYGHSRHV